MALEGVFRLGKKDSSIDRFIQTLLLFIHTKTSFNYCNEKLHVPKAHKYSKQFSLISYWTVTTTLPRSTLPLSPFPSFQVLYCCWYQIQTWHIILALFGFVCIYVCYVYVFEFVCLWMCVCLCMWKFASTIVYLCLWVFARSVMCAFVWVWIFLWICICLYLSVSAICVSVFVT